MYLVRVLMFQVGGDKKHLIACMIIVSMAVVIIMVLLGRNNRYECIFGSLNLNIFSKKISSDRDFS
jgi:hypothetical protein